MRRKWFRKKKNSHVCPVGALRELTGSGWSCRDERETLRVSSTLCRNIPFSHTQSHFKSRTCRVFVPVTSDW
jgi:hypothetical protein